MILGPPPSAVPARNLECCCCGQRTRGRQWWNRDKGYGVCPRCADEHAAKLRRDGYTDRDIEDELQQDYGWRGHHFDIPEKAP